MAVTTKKGGHDDGTLNRPNTMRAKLSPDRLAGIVDDDDDDDEIDPDAQALWDAEIDKRIAEIDSGKVVGLTEEELWGKLRAEFKWFP